MTRKILVIGPNSYIGSRFQSCAAVAHTDWCIDELSVRDDSWKTYSFDGYDWVVYCAAIVHQKGQTHTKADYMEINAKLVQAVAEKAKGDGVKAFLFLSSMAVFGQEGKLGHTTVIKKDTVLAPNTDYGESKLVAEQSLKGLAEEKFQVYVFRPPMVYGSDCPGNYTKLKEFALKYRFFPAIHNQRSMISVDNLCRMMMKEIERLGEDRGDRLTEKGKAEPPEFFHVRHPQDAQYACTLDMVREIVEQEGGSLHVSTLSVPLIYLAGYFVGTVHKVFGSLTYDMKIDE